MERHGIPTARFGVAESIEAAMKVLADFELPLVIKADGLAAGKGVKVVKTHEEALGTLDEFMRQRTMGAAGERVVIEEFVPGEEASFMVLSDGEH
ncbi:MAG: ATP-grasp domain-containing protein, partial [Candidatus Dadabacteria bacterium]|nr:ATP-grasp domain-containing protein [Candidatus Dadabacteria bacterium]